MTTSRPANRYELHSILPAMRLRAPVCCGGVVFCTTDHLDRYAIEPPAIHAAVQRLARQYCDDHGNPLGCVGVELLPETSARDLTRQGTARMCRDAVALCFVTRGASLNCHHQQATTVSNADYFDALPIRLREQGFIIKRPGLFGTSNSLNHYHPTLPTHLGTPRNGDFQLDEFLLHAFDQAVAMYTKRRRCRALRQVFRASAIALQATRILPETESTYYDLGSRIISWVSAFETLVHPGMGSVGLKDVMQLIESVQWSDAPLNVLPGTRRVTMRLGHKRFIFRDRKGRVVGRENAACHLYRRFYNLRNAAAHGNELKTCEFAANPRSRKRARVDEVAPLLFRGCLLERFRQLHVIRTIPSEGTLTPRQFHAAVRQTLNASHFDEALAKVLFGRHGR